MFNKLRQFQLRTKRKVLNRCPLQNRRKLRINDYRCALDAVAEPCEKQGQGMKTSSVAGAKFVLFFASSSALHNEVYVEGRKKKKKKKKKKDPPPEPPPPPAHTLNYSARWSRRDVVVVAAGTLRGRGGCVDARQRTRRSSYAATNRRDNNVLVRLTDERSLYLSIDKRGLPDLVVARVIKTHITAEKISTHEETKTTSF